MPVLRIQGMHCKNCQTAVHKAIGAIPGVKTVDVSLEKGTATWTDEQPDTPANTAAIKEAVQKIGFDAE